MFDQLQEGFARTFRTLRGVGKIRESNISEALSEVRSSLLEADVAYRVAQSFIDSIRARALGSEVLDHVEPGQQFVKIVYDELVRVLGGAAAELPRVSGRPLKILLAGLQGSGKTTTVAKLGRFLRDQRGRRPLLVPADTQRPAAREQLEQLGRDNGLAVYSSRETDPLRIAEGALCSVEGREIAADSLILDTAGRLHIDAPLMEELRKLKALFQPDLTLYVVDAMAGQDAVRSAETFASELGFDGAIVTKMDGDARGGAALSLRLVTGKPIFFVGTGEKVDAIEPLYPDRLASRILGMGDVVTLVEKAQAAMDGKKAEELAKRMRKNQFTIEDFSEQMGALEKMGSFEGLLDLMPGGGQLKKMIPGGGLPKEELKRVDAIIKSMTPSERISYQIIDGSRRKRIAAGSGTTVTDVNRFLKQFVQAKTLMSRLQSGGFRGFGRGGLPF